MEMTRLDRPAENRVEASHSAARELYVEGRRFRVAREGARLEGIQHFGHGAKAMWAGWHRPLAVGEILVCDGWKPGMDSGSDEVNFRHPDTPPGIVWCQVWPMDGLFRPFPMKGWLEPVEGDEAA